MPRSWRAAVAFVRAQGAACENAKGARCRCRCGGALHGVAHGRAWAEEQAAKMMREREELEAQLDVFGLEPLSAFLTDEPPPGG